MKKPMTTVPFKGTPEQQAKLDAVIAAKMLSTNPAKHIGIHNRTGSLEAGKAADLVITDQSFTLKNVIKCGEQVF